MLHGLAVIYSSSGTYHDDESSHGGGAARADDQQIESDTSPPNQSSLLIDATCVSADIPQPADLFLLKVDTVFSEGVARELTETLIHAMHTQVRDSFGHKPRTYYKQVRQQFLAVALPEGF